MTPLLGTPAVAKKKTSAPKSAPKRYGTLIRVTDEFAEVIKEAASIEKMSVAEFAQTHLIEVARTRYKAAVRRLAKKVDESEERGSRP